jgi:molecular chaperone DnaK (HSP70)
MSRPVVGIDLGTTNSVVAAREFGEISSEEAATATASRVEELAAGIAGMAASLKPGTGTGTQL